MMRAAARLASAPNSPCPQSSCPQSFSITTLLFSHPACEDHIPDIGHPENPVRLRAIAQALAASEFAGPLRREPPRAEQDQVARVHPGSIVSAMLSHATGEGTAGMDHATFLSRGSGEGALRAARRDERGGGKERVSKG